MDVPRDGLYELSFWYLTDGEGPFDLIVTALQCCAVNSLSSLFNTSVNNTFYKEASVMVSPASDSTLIEFSAASSTLGALLFYRRCKPDQGGQGSRSSRRCRTARPHLGERRSSRLVATPTSILLI